MKLRVEIIMKEIDFRRKLFSNKQTLKEILFSGKNSHSQILRNLELNERYYKVATISEYSMNLEY